MMHDIGYPEAAAFLRERDGFLVFTHANPDGDTLGSAAALVRVLRYMGKKANAFCPDTIPEKLTFMGTDELFISELPARIETAVCVDIASLQRLGAYADFTEKRIFDLAIDHHRTNTLPCELRLLKPRYVACGEAVYELIKHMGAEIDKQTAIALYTAICSDSGGFKYASTRAETYEYAAELIRKGVDFAKINRILFEQKTLAQLSLERAAYKTLEFHCGGKLAIVAIDKETAERCKAEESDFDTLNQIARQTAGVEVSAMLRPRGNETKVSMRSNEYFDVSDFAKRHGGGGHRHAAGYNFRGNVSEAAKALIEEMKAEFEDVR